MPQPLTPLQPRPIPRSWTPFETLLDEVKLYVPHVADPVALHVVRNSAIDFCRQTGLWIHDVDPIVGIPFQPIYDIPTPDSAVISIVLEAWYAGVRIEGQSIEQLKKRYVNDFRNIVTFNGPPSWF